MKKIYFIASRIVSGIQALSTGLSRFMPAPKPVLWITWPSNNIGINADVDTADATGAVAGPIACNGDAGTITITGYTTAAGGVTSTVITNTRLALADNLQVTIVGYTGTVTTNGEPVLGYVDRIAGQFTVRIYNLHSANALAGDIQISYRVGKPISGN